MWRWRQGQASPQTAATRPGPLARGGVPLGYASDLTPARCRFRSPGTFLIHLRDAGEECPRPFAPQAASSTPPASPRVPGCWRSSRRRGCVSGAFRRRLSADVRVHRTSSDEAKTPSKAAEPIPGALATGRSNTADATSCTSTSFLPWSPPAGRPTRRALSGSGRLHRSPSARGRRSAPQSAARFLAGI